MGDNVSRSDTDNESDNDSTHSETYLTAAENLSNALSNQNIPEANQLIAEYFLYRATAGLRNMTSNAPEPEPEPEPYDPVVFQEALKKMVDIIFKDNQVQKDIRDKTKINFPCNTDINFLKKVKDLSLPLWKKIGLVGYYLHCYLESDRNIQLDQVARLFFSNPDDPATPETNRFKTALMELALNYQEGVKLLEEDFNKDNYNVFIEMNTQDDKALETLLEEEALMPLKILETNSLESLNTQSQFILKKLDERFQKYYYKFRHNVQKLDFNENILTEYLVSKDDKHCLTHEKPDITSQSHPHLIYKERFFIRINARTMHHLKPFYLIFEIFSDFIRKIHCTPVRLRQAVVNDSRLKPGLFTDKLKIILMTMIVYEIEQVDKSMMMNFIFHPSQETLELHFYSSEQYEHESLLKKRRQLLDHIKIVLDKATFWKHDYSFTRDEDKETDADEP